MAAPMVTHVFRLIPKFSCLTVSLDFFCWKSVKIRWYSRGATRSRSGIKVSDVIHKNTDDPSQAKSTVSEMEQIPLKAANHIFSRCQNLISARSNKTIVRIGGLEEAAVPEAAIQFERVQNDDKEFSRTVALVRSRVRRHKERITCLEGAAAILQALRAQNTTIQSVYMLPNGSSSDKRKKFDQLPLMLLSDMGTKFFKIDPDKMKLLCDTTTDGIPSIAGICRMPDPTVVSGPLLFRDSSRLLPICLVVDNIRDPNNMSAIIKTFISSTSHWMLVTKGCVDIWEPKVIRMSGGAQFGANSRIITDLTWSHIRDLLPSDTKLFVADNRSLLPDNTIGLTKRDLCEEAKDYTDMDYSSNSSLAVVIGGETEGISREAYKLCKERSGITVTIPMLRGIDSLNSAVASSIILFDINRQFRSRRERPPDSISQGR